MVTVYADTLVCINMFMTYFLLLASLMICRRPLRRLRLLIASAVGGSYALTLLLEPIPLWLSVPMRVLVCLMLVYIADGFRTVRPFLKVLFVFLLMNFLFAGFMLLVQLRRPDRFLYDTGVLYFDVDIPFLLLTTLAVYLIVQIAVRLSAGRHDAAPQVTVGVTMAGKTVQCVGVVDTGHRLRDPFNGQPVPIITSKIAEKLIPSAKEMLHGQTAAVSVPQELVGKLRFYPYHTVGAKGLLPAFRCNHIEISGSGLSFAADGMYLAVADAPLFGGEADALLPQEIFDAMEENDHAVPNH